MKFFQSPDMTAFKGVSQNGGKFSELLDWYDDELTDAFPKGGTFRELFSLSDYCGLGDNDVMRQYLKTAIPEMLRKARVQFIEVYGGHGTYRWLVRTHNAKGKSLKGQTWFDENPDWIYDMYYSDAYSDKQSEMIHASILENLETVNDCNDGAPLTTDDYYEGAYWLSNVVYEKGYNRDLPLISAYGDDFANNQYGNNRYDHEAQEEYSRYSGYVGSDEIATVINAYVTQGVENMLKALFNIG